MRQATVHSSKGENDSGFTRQGSLRRVLPSQHNKDHIFGRQNEDINTFYKLVHQEYIILAEYKMVVSENLQGVYTIPSKENPFVWFGVIFVRSGLYEDGIFRFNIILPDNFPDGGHPKVIFQSEVHHPVINPETNELRLSAAFPIWTKGDHHVWQVLKYIYWIFHEYEASFQHSIDCNFTEVFKKDPDGFKNKVSNCIRLSHQRLYDPPPTTDKYYITFERFDSELHGPIRASILKEPAECRPNIMGHSWVTPGSLRPLSRTDACDSND